jgi:23S rRNA (cytosine1962-C5)-methyltransferase
MTRSKSRQLRSIQLDKRTAKAIDAGHPWLWPDVFDSTRWKPRCGEIVQLLDAVGAPMGCAIAEGSLRPGVPALRVLSLQSQVPTLRKLVFSRIAAARSLRQRIVSDETDGYRLLAGEGDGLPGLVADRYGSVLVVKPDGQSWRPHHALLVEALRSEGGAGIHSILLRESGEEPRLLHGEDPPESLVFTEEGRRYLVRPASGQKTGFFLDQRPNRTHVQNITRSGDRSLNLFSYTGGFSVAMALGGAAHVHSVDLSESILDDCRQQFRLNHIDPAAHRFQAADIFQWLPTIARLPGDQRYDLIVCDPPALSHKKSDLPKARSAYRRLHQGLAPLLRKGGLLVTASCTARLDDEDLLEDARQGLRDGGRAVQRVVRRAGAGADHPIPPGFPQGRYLSCLTLVVE